MASSVNSSTASQAQLLLLQQQQLASQNALIADLNEVDPNSSSSDTTSGLSLSTNVQQSPTATGLEQLVSAIDAGNLSEAQQAYSSLSALTNAASVTSSGYSQTGQSTTANTNLIQTLAQIGNDLQSGNLAGAKDILSSLKQGGSTGSTSSSAPVEPGSVITINADGSITTTTTASDGTVTVDTTSAPASTAQGNSDTDTLTNLLSTLQNLTV